MLQDKVVIVTGGASGLGYGIAEEVAKQRAKTVIADIDDVGGSASSSSLQAMGFQSSFERVDVSSETSVQNMVTCVLEKYGRIDVLVNNAGVTRFKPLLEMSSDEWDYVMNVDLKGVFLCTKQVLPSMLHHQYGVIVNIASNHVVATLPDTEAYAAAKSGVVGFTKSLGLSFGAKGIRAVAVAPGFTDTPHIQRWLEASKTPDLLKEYTNALHPAKRIAKPADIGRVVAFLASDSAAWITSTTVVVDGGLSSILYNDMDNLNVGIPHN